MSTKITSLLLLTLVLLPTSIVRVDAFSTPVPNTNLVVPSRSSSSSSSSSLASTAAGSSEDGGVRDDVVIEKKNPFAKGGKGRILVLGGSGFLGGTVAKRAILEGYSVTSLSRRGEPPPAESPTSSTSNDDGILLNSIDYRIGDARDINSIRSILNDDNDDQQPYIAIVHAIGLLFDGDSGIGNFNRFVSGSGSIPEDNSTYDDITRVTAFNAIDAAEEYAAKLGGGGGGGPLPFVFTSAAEAGWPDVRGGKIVERTLAPEWLRRYLSAKRTVEKRLLANNDLLRPIIFRPSLIYSLDRVASLPPVGAFFVGNRLGLPFVDRPVTVQSLSFAVVRAIGDGGVRGVQRYMEIDELNKLGR
eukprot:CAMPEP_0198254166 /NCGR_PEP_ID=MMETSP1447-20131203/4528_1 /TAXON_ID=420782 /ORGANISM="Chaetoceros dichaeta, Strain CCMP1751" /LENGTH=358 /DNA_ID=CAMNT_0043940129 /DNA_START=142 /DNA_END=1218 /DNA_ORIENTATION=-